MSLTVRTNMSSLLVQANLNSATKSLNQAMTRMTTGYKINTAGDNAAGFSIAENWVTKLSSLDIVSENAAMGKDMLSTTEENYDLLTSHLQRIRDLTEQASNGTYGSTSLKAIQAEIQSRLEEISRIAENAEFNGINLMTSGSTASNGINLQVGLDADSKSVISLSSSIFADATVSGLFAANAGLMSIVTKANNNTAVSKLNSEQGYQILAAALSGLKKNASGNFVIQTETGAMPKDTLAALDAALADISARVTTLGATQNRVDSAVTALEVQNRNLTSSLSTIRDTDVAKESSNYIQAQILQQASATLLATANQSPSIALNLI